MWVCVGIGLSLTILGQIEERHDFRDHVAPVLEKQCVHCHGGASSKGNLSLTTAQGVFKGGDGGPAVVAGKPEESPLLEMISGDPPEMPKKGASLSRREVAQIRAWIEQGAYWPAGLVLKDRRFDSQRWWSFEPLKRPDPPAVKLKTPGWARTPIDVFIQARLEQEGLTPSPEADRRTLIRRLSFDLIGLPPTPGEIESFVSDEHPGAYEHLVDRLLGSPHYGERWGRHWLDLVHYGDTHGYDKDKRRDHAWPYRDYVIQSFNGDLPYSQFVREQVAGDVLEPGDPRGVSATGFIAAGPWDFVGHAELREGTVDKLKAQLIDRDDMLSNTMSTFVSLTVHCARCHDHKFDPIAQKDYYSLQAVFAGLDRGDRPLGLGPTRPSGRVLAVRASHVYGVIPRAARPIRLLRRGDVEQPGDIARPAALTCLAGAGMPSEFALDASASEGSRRAALAGWLASPANVLTWRSIVNRIWHYHFGRGLVDTPSDFGRNGSLPSHPELLDWLAAELLENGQSLKALHRLIVTSAVYRQRSANNPAAAKVDADNRLLWRQNRRKLEAETVRDSVLAASGTLVKTMGGPGFDLFRFKDDHSPVYDHSDPAKIDNPQVRRRTIYRFTVRSVPNPFLEALDCADPNLNTPVRSQTLTALQALALFNDLFMVRQSQELARRVEQQESDPARRIDVACLRALGRLPTPAERAALAAHAARHGLTQACRVLFNTNEFIFVD
jgi:hypothetical protein